MNPKTSRWARTILSTILFILLLPLSASAEKVIPNEQVTNHVNVRSTPSGNGNPIGTLSPGEQADYLESIPRWHKVRLVNGSIGFVSKAWTTVIPDPIDPSAQSPFAVHFLDVGTGDSAIIDLGDKEIVIDGGENINVLNDYARRTGIIDGPIELLVVTHSDFDHWKGLERLLGFDGVIDNSPGVLEYWDPGYNRECKPPDDGGTKSYLAFVQKVQTRVPAGKFLRPLENHHVPANVSGQIQPFTLSTIPGVVFTLLHSSSAPGEGDCAYRINNASIVLSIEIHGQKFLFTGDANGKERDEFPPGTPKYVEQELLTLEGSFPGTLKAKVLKVPHHGSETASTQKFIDAIDPEFVIISASTRHHLPKDTVIDRYQNGRRVILRTDQNREKDRDHILCIEVGSETECNFADVLQD